MCAAPNAGLWRWGGLSEAERAWIEADPTGRRKRLAFDPDSSRCRVDEAQAAIEAEKQLGPLERAIDSESRSDGGADYRDAHGVAWDVKQGSGGADPILKAVRDGEHMIVDGRGMSAAAQEALVQQLRAAGITGQRVIYVFFEESALSDLKGGGTAVR